MKKSIFTLLFTCILSTVWTQNFDGYSSLRKRQMEFLDRGLVAVKTNTGIFLSWRFLGNDDKNVMFNVYRDNVKLNSTPLTGATNYTDVSGTNDNNYSIGVVSPASLVEISRTSEVKPWADIFKTLQLDRPVAQTAGVGYSPNDCSVGDLDGDGQYEIVVKWDPSNSTDNYYDGYTDKVYLDAYELDGTKLWRIDLGINIRAGAHYTQFLVYDFDGDGNAEVTCMTAPGTIDGQGNYVLLGNDVGTVDLRNSKGRIVTGSEYLTVFDGQTGANKSTIEYQPVRGSLNSWVQSGTEVGNYSYRFLAGVAYLDGIRPSIVMTRGYYFKTALAAFDLTSSGLQQRWLYSIDNTNAWTEAYAQGSHSLSVADVDGDGSDEIIFGGAVINDDGTCKVTTRLGHGDAQHVTDIDPDRPGLEVFRVQEGANKKGQALYDPNSGEIIWAGAVVGGDNGRGVAADIDATHRGLECWSALYTGIYDCKGTRISNKKPTARNDLGNGWSNYNFRIYWDGDLQDELLDKEAVSKWSPAKDTTDVICNLNDYSPVNFNNGTKSNPCLSADIFGDWREEIIASSADSTKLVIYTTNIPTNHRLYTLMHDPVYRLSVAWQNVGYNQPPHLGFYMGDGLDNIPYPRMYTQYDEAVQPVNLYKLKNVIKEAQNLFDSSEKGKNTLQFPESAFSALNVAIVDGQNYMNSIDPETPEVDGQSGIDSTEAVLHNAISIFRSRQILVFANPADTVFYSIYSYGNANASDTLALNTMTKKFLTDSGSSLTYQTGTADTYEVNMSDPLRMDYSAQWEITSVVDKPGYMIIKNRETGKYLQISESMSDTPVEIYLPYKKTENTKVGYALAVTETTDNCLQISTSPSVNVASYIDRVQMRWIIEPAKEKGQESDSSVVVNLPDLVFYDATNLADWSVQMNLQTGDLQYGDRDFTLVTIPNELIGSTWIRTANDSKAFASDAASFTAASNMFVYIAHKDDITSKPTWLNDYSNTGLDIINNETKNQTLSLFKKSFNKGDKIVLGKNGSTTGQGMYTVILVKDNTKTAIHSSKTESKYVQYVYPDYQEGSIRFGLNIDYSTDLNISIFDTMGRLIENQKYGVLINGFNTINLKINSGLLKKRDIYIYRIQTGNEIITGKILF